MTIDQLPPDGTKVLFRSNVPNPARQTLNESVCTILSREELSPESLVYQKYTDHIAVEIRFPYHCEDSRHNGGVTWADLNEIHLIALPHDT